MDDLSKNEQVNINDQDESIKNNKPSIFKNGIINTLYQMLIIITPLITTPYVSRILGADGIGVYSYTHSLVTYFVMFAGLGTVSYGTREIARRRLSKCDYSQAFWEIEILTLITSATCILIWCTISYLYKDYTIYLFICTMYILATLFDISWLYAGLEKFKYTIIINSLFKIGGIVAIFIFVKNDNDIFNYILINAGVIMLGNISMWIFLPVVLSKCRFSFKSLRIHFKETLIYFIPTIATTIYTVLDKSLLGIICKSDELNGYYEQGTKILNISKTIAFVGVIGVVMPRMSFLYKINDIEQVKKILYVSSNIVFSLSTSITIGVISIADIFIPMFLGDGYSEVVKIIYFMMPLCFIISISYLLGGLYYTPIGKRKLSSLFLIIASIVNLSLNLVFIPLWNIYGAIIASIIAEILIVVLYLIYCDNFITIKQLVKYLWKKIIASGVMFIAIYFFKRINIHVFDIEIYNLIIKNILCIFIGVLSFFIVLLVLNDEIIKIVKRIIFRR